MVNMYYKYYITKDLKLLGLVIEMEKRLRLKGENKVEERSKVKILNQRNPEGWLN